MAMTQTHSLVNGGKGQPGRFYVAISQVVEVAIPKWKKKFISLLINHKTLLIHK